MDPPQGGTTKAALVIGGAALAAATIFFFLGSASAQTVLTAKVPGVCGNGIIEFDEQCEPGPPELLGGATCVSLGFASGVLSCSPSCLFNTSLCISGGAPGGRRLPPGEVNEWIFPLPEFIFPPFLLPPPLIVSCPRIGFDLDGDGAVDLRDLSIFLFWFPKTGPDALVYDLNCDGKLGLADLSVLFYHWTDFFRLIA